MHASEIWHAFFHLFIVFGATWVTEATAAAALDAPVCSNSSSSASSSSTTAGASLLQKHAIRGRMALEESGSGPDGFNGRPDARARPSTLGATSILQKEGETVSHLIGRSRSRNHAAYASYVRSKMDALEKSRNASNSELDGLISRFIEEHTSSEDSCPPKLMEAKHQLNSLHKELLDLAAQIHGTEAEVQKLESQAQVLPPKIHEIEEQCKKRMDELEAQKEANRQMLAKLRLEMEEMKAIAQPEVTMNLTNLSVSGTGGPLSLLQKQARPSEAKALQTEELVKMTKDAAQNVLNCMVSTKGQRSSSVLLAISSSGSVKRVAGPADCGVNSSSAAVVGNTTVAITSPVLIKNQTYRSYSCNKIDNDYGGSIWLHCSNTLLSADGRGCIKLPNTVECQRQKADLEEKYVKAYVELSRLLAEYEELVSSTDAEDALLEDCKQKKGVLQDEHDKLVSNLKVKLQELQNLRPKLEDMISAEGKLRKHLDELTSICSTMDQTGRGLDDVREAIHALEACPGLYRPEFHIPLWVGEWASFELDNTKSDKANDAAMTAACQAQFGDGVRAAEVSEIEGGFIEDMPPNSTALLPLLGACPKCEGTPDEAGSGVVNADGHSRICWDTGKPLNRKPANRREDCSKHMKAIMCVRDRGNIRSSDWMAYQSVCAGTATSFTDAESQQMLELHNKMRCTVGSSPLKWSRTLQCQAQAWADKCNFSHSDLPNSPIPASENLATGTSIDMAAWMWYTEYTVENPARSLSTGHFTAMVWNASTELGCGICRNGGNFGGVIVCQYANSRGNLVGQYDGNVSSFAGFASDYERCHLNVTTAKENIQKFEGWGVISPQPAIVANLG